MVLRTFSGAIPSDPTWLENSSGQFEGQVVFTCHSNKDIQAHQWSVVAGGRWLNIGGFSHERQCIEGQLEKVRLRGQKLPGIPSNTLAYFRAVAKQKEIDCMPLESHGEAAAQQQVAIANLFAEAADDYRQIITTSSNEATVRGVSTSGAATAEPAMATAGDHATFPEDPFVAGPLTYTHPVTSSPAMMPSTSPAYFSAPYGPHFVPATTHGTAATQYQAASSYQWAQMGVSQGLHLESGGVSTNDQAIWAGTSTQSQSIASGVPNGQRLLQLPFADPSHYTVLHSSSSPAQVTNDEVSTTIPTSHVLPTQKVQAAPIPAPSATGLRGGDHEPVHHTPSKKTSAQSHIIFGSNTKNTDDIITPSRKAALERDKEHKRLSDEFYEKLRAKSEEVEEVNRTSTPMETFKPGPLPAKSKFESKAEAKAAEEPDAWKSGHITRLREDDHLKYLHQVHGTSLADHPLSRALYSVNENLVAYQDEAKGQKQRDYFTRHYKKPADWLVDSSAGGGESFFGEDYGAAPARVGRDPRYRDVPMPIGFEMRQSAMPVPAGRRWGQF